MRQRAQLQEPLSEWVAASEKLGLTKAAAELNKLRGLTEKGLEKLSFVSNTMKTKWRKRRKERLRKREERRKKMHVENQARKKLNELEAARRRRSSAPSIDRMRRRVSAAYGPGSRPSVGQALDEVEEKGDIAPPVQSNEAASTEKRDESGSSAQEESKAEVPVEEEGVRPQQFVSFRSQESPTSLDPNSQRYLRHIIPDPALLQQSSEYFPPQQPDEDEVAWDDDRALQQFVEDEEVVGAGGEFDREWYLQDEELSLDSESELQRFKVAQRNQAYYPSQESTAEERADEVEYRPLSSRAKSSSVGFVERLGEDDALSRGERFLSDAQRAKYDLKVPSGQVEEESLLSLMSQETDESLTSQQTETSSEYADERYSEFLRGRDPESLSTLSQDQIRQPMLLREARYHARDSLSSDIAVGKKTDRGRHRISSDRPSPISTDRTSSRDHSSTASRDRPSTVSRDRPSTESGDRSTTVSRDRPSTESGDRSTTVSRDRPSTVSRDRPSTESGDRSTTVSRDRPITESGDRSTTVSRDRPSTESGDRSSTVSRNRPSTESGDRSSTVSRNRPSTESGDRSSSVSRNRPSTESGDRPSTESGNASSTVSRNRPSTESEDRSTTVSRNRPSTESGDRSSTVSRDHPSTESGDNTSTVSSDRSSTASTVRTSSSDRPTIISRGRPSPSSRGCPSTTTSLKSKLRSATASRFPGSFWADSSSRKGQSPDAISQIRSSFAEHHDSQDSSVLSQYRASDNDQSNEDAVAGNACILNAVAQEHTAKSGKLLNRLSRIVSDDGQTRPGQSSDANNGDFQPRLAIDGIPWAARPSAKGKQVGREPLKVSQTSSQRQTSHENNQQGLVFDEPQRAWDDVFNTDPEQLSLDSETDEQWTRLRSQQTGRSQSNEALDSADDARGSGSQRQSEVPNQSVASTAVHSADTVGQKSLKSEGLGETPALQRTSNDVPSE